MEGSMERSMSELTVALRRKRSRRKVRRQSVIPAVLIILVIGIITGGYFWYQGDSAVKTKKQPKNEVTENVLDRGKFNILVNSQVLFQNSSESGSLGLQNVSANRYDCRARMRMDDDGSVIYESETLSPGQSVDQIRLSRELASGTYPCTVSMIATDPDTQQEVGQVDVKVNVVILN